MPLALTSWLEATGFTYLALMDKSFALTSAVKSFVFTLAVKSFALTSAVKSFALTSAHKSLALRPWLTYVLDFNTASFPSSWQRQFSDDWKTRPKIIRTALFTATIVHIISVVSGQVKQEGSWDRGVDGVGNLAHFMHKISLFH